MNKLIFILWLLVANISCSQANKDKEIRIENNYEFIAKNGDYEGLLLQSDNLYIFTHQYGKSIDKQYIKVFKRKISDSIFCRPDMRSGKPRSDGVTFSETSII